LFDAALVFISRLRRGIPLMQGGVDHLSHRVCRIGLGPLGATFALDLVGVALGMTAVFTMQANLAEGYAMGAIVFVLACYLLWNLEWRLSYELRTGKPHGGDGSADSP